MENIGRIKNVIEALLIVSEEGLSAQDLVDAITSVDLKDVEEAVQSLKEDYETSGRAFSIMEVGGKCRIFTKPEYMPWISNLYKKDIDRLSGPSLETLAIIAYKQPVTRAEVEAVRGVNVGGVMKALLDKDLIQVRGRRDVLGRPLVYGTTEKFLEIFGLNSLNDLPVLREFAEEDLEYTKPAKQVLVKNEEENISSSAVSVSTNADVVIEATELVKKESHDDEFTEFDGT
ncbi:MAG: SMC-Scp complex subunit ScpB [Candidatus Omnitrophota bacterium]|nr:SMC-Scp complex subunit ScpB [Candidatus Omnitrophota bacterium]